MSTILWATQNLMSIYESVIRLPDIFNCDPVQIQQILFGNCVELVVLSHWDIPSPLIFFDQAVKFLFFETKKKWFCLNFFL